MSFGNRGIVTIELNGLGWGRVVREGVGCGGFERGGEQEHVHLCSIRRDEPSSTLFL